MTENQKLREALQYAYSCLTNQLSTRTKHEYAVDQITQALALPTTEPSNTAPNLACKSVQKRLATQWGYVLPTTQAQEPIQTDKAALQMLVAGALFDFAGYLTTLPEPLAIGAAEFSGPMVEHLKKWAETRKLPLDEAAVMSWQDAIATQPQAQEPRHCPACVLPEVQSHGIHIGSGDG